ncbi:MAG TPA: pyridoxal phosphate-dependent aminotransferase [Rectinemataceae bacterium]|nr:pyridoxal phosphate-dependent aminotransferase [Rectinemataceae bacterium]
MSDPFSRRLSWPAPANSLSTTRAGLIAEGRDILDWSDSNPRRVLPLEGYEYENLASLFDNPDNLRYEPDPRGLLRAREALALHRGTGIGPRQYFLTASSSEAYGWLFKLLCDPGDAILVPRPGYPLFDYLAGLESVQVSPWRLEYVHPHGWEIDFDSIEEAIAAGRRGEGGRIKAIVLINPNNPTGSYISEAERERFVSIAARAGIALIVDEVFLAFPVEAGEAPARRGWSFEGEEGVLTFVLDGLSKSLGLPQLKLGWIAASGPHRLLEEAMERLEIIADSYLSAGTPVMNALPHLLERALPFATALRGRLATNLAALRRGLEHRSSPHRVYRCEGGWTAIIESPRFLGEEEIALRLLSEAGLWSQPGHFFDMEREAIFTASLILPEASFAEGLARYAGWFTDEEYRS